MKADASDQPDAARQRRAFLRTLSGGAAALGLPALLAACGGGSSSGGSDGGDDSGSEDGVDPAARVATLQAVENHCRELSQQSLAPSAFVEAVAAYLRAQPLYAEVGVDAATSTAWGVFADGRIHLIANNYRPVRSPSLARRDSAAMETAGEKELPSASTARVLQTFGPTFDTADTVAALSNSLRKAGYTQRFGDPDFAHVATLREVQGDGYFYINTHGGAFQPTLSPNSGQVMYSIQSSTLVTAAGEADPVMRADFAQRRLTYFTATNGGTLLGLFPDLDTRYGITANFVEAYWRFAANSVVIINACSSARTGEAKWAAGFVFACHKVGAGVYFGWNETVAPPGAFRAVKYLTDRLLGANRFEPETPAQRPFAWDAVMADMRKKSIDVDPDNGATFLALPRPAGGGMRQLLAPSIHHVEVDEYRDELELYGWFGAEQGEVFVESTSAPVTQWTPERIVCRLAPTGPGCAGPVQVVVRGVKSNIRHLTEWTLMLSYTYIFMEARGLKVAGVGAIRLRADVGATREAPGEVPAQPVRYTIATRDSKLPLTASGSYPAGPCSIDWSGSATYEAIPAPDARRVLFAYLKADTSTRSASLGLALGALSPDFTQSGCTTSQFQVSFGTLEGQVSYPSPVENSTDVIPLQSLVRPFDERFGIAAGTFENVMVRLTWDAVVARHPPLPADGS